MNKTLRNTLIGVAVVVLLIVLLNLIPDKNYSSKYEGFDLTSSAGTVDRSSTYKQYLANHKNAGKPASVIEVNVAEFDESSTGVKLEASYQGKDNVLVTEDGSFVQWTVDVPTEGFYNLEMEYIAVPSRNVNMERILYINGEIPFTGADLISFQRLWKDGGEIRTDNRGNQIRPSQMEIYDWQTVPFKSDSGYEVDPYQFYFKKGVNTIGFKATNEPIAIKSIKIKPVESIDTYEQYLAKQKSKPEKYTSTEVSVRVQGENSIRRSDPSLFARYDRSSAVTEPYSIDRTIFNYIGGESWKAPGQWIEWELNVPEDGWYQISFQARQLYQRGYISARSIYIDDEIPFDDLKNVGFNYSTDWKLITLSDSNNNPFKFYLSKGTHVLKMEATLGEIGPLISELEDSIYRLNVIYRTLMVLTGTQPDAYRDYHIDKVYPNEVEAMNIESKRLYKIVDDFVKVTGQKSDKVAPAQTLAVQLEQFYKNPDKITKSFQNFKDNVTSLGTSLLSLTECKLDIDFIQLDSVNDKPKARKTNFFLNAKHEIVSFFTSFFVDASMLGNVYEEGDEHLIEVWIVTGRDQSQILKNMIDDSFSPSTGIHVNVKLINIDALLNAVVAGKGPDVVVSCDVSKPVDYALRHANVNLMQFPDAEEVFKRFKPSSYEAYSYDGGVYGIPETTTFNLLFYRKDILEQLGVQVPQTWEELIEILPTIQGNNLEVGIPYPSIQTPDMSTFYAMTYQNGGSVYNERGTKTAIDSEAGVSAFKLYTSLFNSYGLPVVYDFVSRFRSGQMPIGIVNYQTYNTLVVSAPEIHGLWDFTLLPGTMKVDKDGNTYIDRTTTTGGVCSMMINKSVEKNIETDAVTDGLGSAKAGDKESIRSKNDAAYQRNQTRMNDSWEFMKWWTSTEAQVRFGREMEAVMGASARHPTANIEALQQLSWSSDQVKILLESLEDSKGVPEVPGSYYTNRHMVNSIRVVVSEKDDPREVLIEYSRKINDELTKKRQEFNLPTE